MNITAEAFNFEWHEDATTATGNLLFYPWCMAQLWPALWDVPIRTDFTNQERNINIFSLIKKN